MNNICTNCGHEAKEGEVFSVFIDPTKDDGFIHVFSDIHYCQKCASRIKSNKDLLESVSRLGICPEKRCKGTGTCNDRCISKDAE